jgi:sulfate adenylyltransferase
MEINKVLPHGGMLIERIASAEEKERILKRVDELPRLALDREQVKDVKNIAQGVYSPLKGFLKKEDFESVVNDMRLANGLVWPIPIVLDITEEEKKNIEGQKEILLQDEEEVLVAVLQDWDIYDYDKDVFAQNVFGTQDEKHPGVEAVYAMKQYLIGGDITMVNDSGSLFPEHNFKPAETRALFQERGWKTVVAFQTRNVPHRGHEFLQKAALEHADGLFVQPVVGEKKFQDFKDEYVVGAYEILVEKYYPKNRILLSTLPLKMRYAGPREAVFHALIRKNFGCTHFIVGRDHAGVGDYYSPYAAQEIFEQFDKEEIGVEILKFPEVVWRPSIQKHAFLPDAPEDDRVSFSGTRLRQYIAEKEQPPDWLIRPEVYNLLIQSYNVLINPMDKKGNNSSQRGFVLWLTGLSAAGKTTIADLVYKELQEQGYKVERLDGDVVREYLSRDLGFSKEDRDENIRRVGFICKLLSRNGVGVIASFISPYRQVRDAVRSSVENFVEVYCSAPLEICEARDRKGLYKKARAGELEEFTGISDPYEAPENPEVILDTSGPYAKENAKKLVIYLKDKELIS